LISLRAEASLFDPPLREGNSLLLDLSVDNRDPDFLGAHNCASLERYIFGRIEAAGAQYGWGGYGEVRPFYQRFNHFGSASAERNHHLGIDIWAPAFTPVYCPLPGKVHSCAYNRALGDYGGTLVVEHRSSTGPFYSLYGHLSKASALDWKTGDFMVAGQKVAELGPEAENVGWPPHLHFQLIHRLENFWGDYPGVVAASSRNAYLANCPDPRPFLDLPVV